MYWYYKIPLIILGLLVALGLARVVWTHLPQGVHEHVVFWKQNPKTGAPQKSTGAGKPPAPALSPPAPGATPPAETSTAPPPAPNPPGRPLPAEQEQRLKAAEKQLKNDKLVAARELARIVLHSPACTPFSPLWKRAVAIVNQVDTILIHTDAPCPEKVAYIIKSGDSLSRIAKQFNTTVAAIQMCNNMAPDNSTIYPGKVLHIFRGQWSITVKRSRFTLILYDGKEIFKTYTVGIGKQDRTPLGVFRIRAKIREPAWTPLGRPRIPYGDPRNVLGTRWLALQPIEGTDPTLRGYGIHGTWKPETVGTPCSLGCIRMRNKDVEELFDIVPVGTRVVIEDK